MIDCRQLPWLYDAAAVAEIVEWVWFHDVCVEQRADGTLLVGGLAAGPGDYLHWDGEGFMVQDGDSIEALRDALDALDGTVEQPELDVVRLRAAGYALVDVTDERHLIEFWAGGWTIAHPFVERLDLATLFACPYRWGGFHAGPAGRYVLNRDGTTGERA